MMNAHEKLKQKLIRLLDEIWINMPDIDSIKDMADSPANTEMVEEDYHKTHALILEAKGLVEGL